MRLCMLWVDDEPDSLRYECKIAENLGWHITFVTTVFDALELLRDQYFDLVITDLIFYEDRFEQDRGLVKIDAGIVLIEAIRDSNRKGSTLSTTPLLIISGVISPSKLEKVIPKIGSNSYYLSKPLVGDEYLNILVEMTDKIISNEKKVHGAN